MEAFQEIERRLAEWAGCHPGNMVACASGTAALHLALECLRLPPGSEVLVPDYGMIACPRAVTLAGLVPTFIDCRDDLNIDPSLAETGGVKRARGGRLYVERNVRAIMAVHVYGRRCDMDRLAETATRHDLHLVEDMAEIHGVRPHPATDAACWSFYKNKIVAGEEGGAVSFRDPAAAALARRLRTLGFTDDHDFWHVPRGHNYRMSNAHAALVLDSLSRFEMNTRLRRHAESLYDEACPPGWKMPPRNAPWVYDVRVPGMTAETQAKAVALLNGRGIAARHGFKPCHRQPEYVGSTYVGGGKSVAVSSEILYLPLFPPEAASAGAEALKNLPDSCWLAD